MTPDEVAAVLKMAPRFENHPPWVCGGGCAFADGGAHDEDVCIRLAHLLEVAAAKGVGDSRSRVVFDSKEQA